MALLKKTIPPKEKELARGKSIPEASSALIIVPGANTLRRGRASNQKRERKKNQFPPPKKCPTLNSSGSFPKKDYRSRCMQ